MNTTIKMCYKCDGRFFLMRIAACGRMRCSSEKWNNVFAFYSTENDRYFYGDFGQMLWAQSYMVGCGRSRFMVCSLCNKTSRVGTVL